MKARAAAYLPESEFDRSRPQHNLHTDALAELGGSSKRKRRPYYLLRCFSVVVCGSVSLIALTVFFWFYHLDFQSVLRARFDLEQKLLAIEGRLKESESQKAKLQEECRKLKITEIQMNHTEQHPKIEHNRKNTTLLQSPKDALRMRRDHVTTDTPW